MSTQESCIEIRCNPILNFSDVLKHLVGKKVFICCTSKKMIISGSLSSFTSRKVVITENSKEYTIDLINVSSISAPNNEDTFNSIEAKAKHKLTNRFHEYIDCYIECMNKKSDLGRWCNCGVVTYVGLDYITFFCEKDKFYSRVPVDNLGSILTVWKKEKNR